MKMLMNYANAPYRLGQRNNSRTGLLKGNFDEVISYGPRDIDAAFFEANQDILSWERGNGYWLWKPYFIDRSFKLLSEGDYLFYCDSGADFLDSVDPLIALCNRLGQDIIPFELPYLEKCWTKRDAFVLMDCDQEAYTDSQQRLASYILFRKSDRSVAFVREFLALARDERLITDLGNQEGYPNYTGFQEHRHDQSIFSLLTKRYRLEAFRDPSQFGDELKDKYPNSPYGTLIHLHRCRSIPDRIVRKVWKSFKALHKRSKGQV